ncbi:MAG: hypothetical protein R3C20_23650 [Planctomycetaceae bacterium]
MNRSPGPRWSIARVLSVCIAVSSSLFLHPASVVAQGFRVSTHVYNVAGAGGADSVLSSSLSLFSNGRVYDYIDAADEVIIFDPMQKKFTILNVARELTTTISFEEIRRHLDKRVPTVEQYLQELAQQRNPSAEAVATNLRFQLNPEFRRDYKAMNGHLELTSSSWNYRVETQPWQNADQVETYLQYADWTARLNHVLHPGSFFPEPRLALNKSLRELKTRVPVAIELDLRPSESLHIRAQHQFRQGLDDDDRRRIARWDHAAASQSVRQLPFLSYQQTVLLSRK